MLPSRSVCPLLAAQLIFMLMIGFEAFMCCLVAAL
jgi:hypothetical protein